MQQDLKAPASIYLTSSYWPRRGPSCAPPAVGSLTVSSISTSSRILAPARDPHAQAFFIHPYMILALAAVYCSIKASATAWGAHTAPALSPYAMSRWRLLDTTASQHQ